MTGPITFEFLGVVVLVVGTLFGFWWRIDARFRAAEKELSAFKVSVAQQYASVDHLKEVEVRLTTAIDNLTSRIDRLIAIAEKARAD